MIQRGGPVIMICPINRVAAKSDSGSGNESCSNTYAMPGFCNAVSIETTIIWGRVSFARKAAKAPNIYPVHATLIPAAIMFRFNSFNKCKLTKRPPPSVSMNKIIVIRRINFIDL